jgi:hypothetical protein
MSQRDSGYARIAFDQYETPEWATRALLPHILGGLVIWEPACGSGKMSRVLNAHLATDIQAGRDFLQERRPEGINAVITNPPYSTATEFIDHALELMEPVGGAVAMKSSSVETEFLNMSKADSSQSPAHSRRFVRCWVREQKSSPRQWLGRR